MKSIDNYTKKELYKIAQELRIGGRSRLIKRELYDVVKRRLASYHIKKGGERHIENYCNIHILSQIDKYNTGLWEGTHTINITREGYYMYRIPCKDRYWGVEIGQTPPIRFTYGELKHMFSECRISAKNHIKNIHRIKMMYENNTTDVVFYVFSAKKPILIVLAGPGIYHENGKLKTLPFRRILYDWTTTDTIHIKHFNRVIAKKHNKNLEIETTDLDISFKMRASYIKYMLKNRDFNSLDKMPKFIMHRYAAAMLRYFRKNKEIKEYLQKFLRKRYIQKKQYKIYL